MYIQTWYFLQDRGQYLQSTCFQISHNTITFVTFSVGVVLAFGGSQEGKASFS
jgi:hypothetical protein